MLVTSHPPALFQLPHLTLFSLTGLHSFPPHSHRAEIRQKNLFSVKEIGIHWHPQGDYLCVKVERYTKSKKSSNMVGQLGAALGPC
jgi:hypothetical protein